MTTRRTALMALLMAGTSIAGVSFRPEAKAAIPPQFAKNVPKAFGNWKTLDQRVGVDDPVVVAIYTDYLARTYANADGYQVMLCLAYGNDQRSNLQAHRPEVCYPAQGFKVISKAQEGPLETPFGAIEATRLTAQAGERTEPISYWLTNGNQVVRNDFERRVAQFKAALTGEIPDGLVFRVSSIDKDSSGAFTEQQRFVADLMASVPAAYRQRLSGLGPDTSA
jgi:EpsI family protein